MLMKKAILILSFGALLAFVFAVDVYAAPSDVGKELTMQPYSFELTLKAPMVVEVVPFHRLSVPAPLAPLHVFAWCNPEQAYKDLFAWIYTDRSCYLQNENFAADVGPRCCGIKYLARSSLQKPGTEKPYNAGAMETGYS